MSLEKNFKYLDNLIHGETNNIFLDSDIALGFNEESEYLEGIELDVDNLVIDGNGHTIDALGMARIFKCSAKNITLKNLTLKNGYTEKKGSAICNEGELTIIKSQLSENISRDGGGAICNEAKLTIEESSFTDNKSPVSGLSTEYSGGAIFNNSELSIASSIFNNNKAGIAGAIHNEGKLTIEESSFTDNFALDEFRSMGGAIYSCGKLSISESALNGNFSENVAGAIFNWQGELIINRSEISDNEAETGGAVYNFEGEATITESLFNNNKSRADGGAIENNSGELDVMKSTFNHNETARYGGAIHNNEGRLNLTDSTLSENSSTGSFYNDGFGGAIHSNREAIITGCEFRENGTHYGGAINNESRLILTQSIFDKNRADSGGAVKNWEGQISEIISCKFKENTGEKDNGAIDNEGNLKIIDCEFSSNKSPENIISNFDSMQIRNTYFADNESKHIIRNDSIWTEEQMNSIWFLKPDTNLCIFNCRFIKNNVEDSVLCNSGKFCTIEASIFENNIACPNSINIENNMGMTLINPEINDEGKTILNNEYILVKKSPKSLESKIYGDGIVEIAELIPSDKFDFRHLDKLIHESDTKEIALNNDIKLENYEMELYKSGIDLDIDDLVIDGGGHSIDGCGTARIFTISGKNITLNNIVFKNGHSHTDYDDLKKRPGGALMVKPQAVATVTNCNFTSNSAWTGGAILNLGELTIEKSEFTENEANLNGGAINNNEGKLRILNSVFTKNMVTTKSMPHGYGGGAICNTGDLEINNTAFTENTAVYGGAINNDKDLRIIDSKFHKNIATGVLCGGGAINNKTGTVTMLKSELKKNESEVHGGAIFNRKGMISITSCEFTENASKNGGAIENHGKSDITESIIGKNTANGKGGAIFNGGELNIMESTLNDNRSDEGEGAIHDDEDAKSSVAKCTIERNKSKKKEDASSERGGLEKLFEEYFSDN